MLSVGQFQVVAVDIQKKLRRALKERAAQIESTPERTASEVGDQTGTDTRFESPRIDRLHIFIQTPDAVGISFVRQLNLNVDGEALPTRQAVAALFIHVQGKVLAVTAETGFESYTDLSEVEDHARDFLSRQTRP
jgi:hypothetical protein